MSYASSVDGWPLSYSEWLPWNYSSNGSYPLVVYLHGQQSVTGQWISGGVPDDLWQYLNASNVNGQTARALVTGVTAAGFILIALDSRSGAGWYIDSPCGGPQQQDVMDAIHHEQGMRNVSGLYLIGVSMGTEGALYTASLHPGLFAGVAIVSPVTDLFEDVSYRVFLAETQNQTDPWAYASIQAKEHLFCGVLAGTENASQRAAASMFLNMSPLRFAPQTFSAVRLYATIGGLDDRTPNSVAVWPNWLNVNDTFLTETCHVASALGEPPGCTTPLLTLHQQQPGAYGFRIVFDPGASHGLTALNISDLLGFWAGSAPGGVYNAPGYPPTAVRPLPGFSYATPTSPTYSVELEEAGLAPGTNWSADLGGIEVESNGSSAVVNLANGSYPYRFGSVTGYLSDSAGFVAVSGLNVSLAATFLSTATYRVAFIERGLPANLSWAVSAGPQSNATDAREIDLTLANGTYAFAVTAPPLFGQLANGVVVVAGGALTVNVSLDLLDYQLVTFNESGLPNGTAWQVEVDGRSQVSVDSAMAFALTNGTFAYEAIATDVQASAIPGTVVVNGTPVQVNLTFGAVLYLATFTESGLPSSADWAVRLNGSVQSTSNASLSFPIPNGTYSYGVLSPPGYLVTPGSGSVAIAGASETVALAFRVATYLVTFVAGGLAAGTTWSVSVGTSTNTSSTARIGFLLPNASYSYAPGAVSGYVTPAAGRFNVSGTALTLNIAYPKLAWFGVKFTESTLPASTSWSVTLGSGPGSSLSTTGTSISFSQMNGSYSYQVGRVTGYLSSPSAGSVSVLGVTVRVIVTFTAIKYAVSFIEAGLPAGTTWKVTVGSTSISSTTSGLNFSLPNGSYSYTVGPVSGYVSPAGSTFSVAGPGASFHLTFPKLVYSSVKFTEAGLPKGTSWSVGLGQTSLSTTSSTGTSISFSQKNGTYRYVVTPVPGFRVSPSNGTVIVAGAAITISLSFSAPTYSVTFSETGLAASTSWKVTIGSTTVTSTRTTASFTLANGTYGYTIGSVSGYTGPPGASVSVSGGPVSVGLTFVKVVKFSVKFTESGLAAGTAWTVSMPGHSANGTGTSLSISMTNGTYAYSASSPSRPGVQLNGSVHVNGSAVGVKVTFPAGAAAPATGGAAGSGLVPPATARIAGTVRAADARGRGR